ncbi:response regulator [Lachnospiraceae bacterium 50-23]
MQKRILVVDDDEVNLMRTKRILEKNYDVILVESGAEALNTIKSEKIDLILLDIAMPKMG